MREKIVSLLLHEVCRQRSLSRQTSLRLFQIFRVFFFRVSLWYKSPDVSHRLAKSSDRHRNRTAMEGVVRLLSRCDFGIGREPGPPSVILLVVTPSSPPRALLAHL